MRLAFSTLTPEDGRPMATPVRLESIVEGMEFQSDEAHSFLHRPSGQVLTLSDEALAAAETEDVEPDRARWMSAAEMEEARKIVAARDDYLALPERFEINEYHMMQRFADGRGNVDEREALLRAIHGRGAFRHFKDTAHRLDLSDAWHAYRDDCYREVARQWCDKHGLEYDDPPRGV